MPPWMLHGANGYTGQLIAREAARRGLVPTLAGRGPGKVGALARELGLAHRVFALDRADDAAGLDGMALVLHCAGPFSATGAPMMERCLRSGAHHLDITGEIDVFEQAHARDARARAAGVLLCPGVGFDSRSGISPGTARTAAEGIALGGRVRWIVRVPHGHRTRRIDFGGGVRTAMTLAWGDVSTAFHTTGSPNIEVYAALQTRNL